MLTGKYGDPNSENIEMVQNAMGATFSNLISEWRFEEGTLVLKQRSGKIDKGFLTFENPTVEREIALGAMQRQQKAGKKAF